MFINFTNQFIIKFTLELNKSFSIYNKSYIVKVIENIGWCALESTIRANRVPH